MKNLKSVILNESVKYLKSNCAKVVNKLTQEHHKVIKQFLAYKERTQRDLDIARKYMKNMQHREIQDAIENPILELFYNKQKSSPLQLYDSIIPCLSHTKRYRIKAKVEEKKNGSEEDKEDAEEESETVTKEYETISSVSDSVNYKTNLAEQNKEIVTLNICNRELKSTNERMQCDLEVVDWYIEILEKGIKS